MRRPIPVDNVSIKTFAAQSYSGVSAEVMSQDISNVLSYIRDYRLLAWQQMREDNSIPLRSNEKISQDIKAVIYRIAQLFRDHKDLRDQIVSAIDFPLLREMGSLMVFFAEQSPEMKKDLHITQTIWAFYQMRFIYNVLPLPPKSNPHIYQFLFALITPLVSLLPKAVEEVNPKISNVMCAIGMMTDVILFLPDDLSSVTALLGLLKLGKSNYQDMVNVTVGFGLLVGSYNTRTEAAKIQSGLNVRECFAAILNSCERLSQSLFNQESLFALDVFSESLFQDAARRISRTQEFSRDFKQILTAITHIKEALRREQYIPSVAATLNLRAFQAPLQTARKGDNAELLRAPSPL